MSSYHPSEALLAQMPQPDSVEIQHSEKLVDLVVAEIERQGGTISFYDYMNLLLYAPTLGYYSGGLAKIGSDGDFVLEVDHFHTHLLTTVPMIHDGRA